MTTIDRSLSELQANARITAILESISSAFFALDQEWRFTYINRHAERLMKRTRETLLGKNIWEEFPDVVDTVFYHEYRRAVAENVTVSFEGFYAPRDRWVEVHACPSPEGLSVYYRDVSERVVTQQKLQQSEERFALAVEGSQDGLWDWDIRTDVAYFSPRWKSMIGYEDHELTNHVDTWVALLLPEDRERTLEALQNYFDRKSPAYEIEFRFRHKDGSYRWILARGAALRDAEGRPYRMAGSHTDVTAWREAATQLELQKRELAEANAKLEALATIDGLTGLKNHRTFQERLAEEFERSVRYRLPLSLLLLDVDKFKQINDAFGHPVGDTALKAVARTLENTVRQTDLPARYGGEEFVVILPGTEAAEAKTVAERVRAAIEAAPWKKRPITVSIGVATLAADIADPSTLIAEADKALYQSKQHGRNRVTHIRDMREEAASGERLLKPYTDLIRMMIEAQHETLMSASECVQETMRRSYDATILSWSRILEMRDKESAGHTERVTAMTERLARSVGMNEEETLYVRWGVLLLHDIGKMGVPDDILLKPGPLTEAEWEVMRRHTNVAYEMLSPIAFLRPALDVPYCHHEKWDGTGYPRGLKGEAIPLAARLFAVVDVWDALRSDRPYRSGWPERKVRAYLREQAGSHFDPRAVTAFLKLFRKRAGSADRLAPCEPPLPSL